MNPFPAKSLLSCAIVFALLQGCGGGGGGGSEASAPPATAEAPTGAALTPATPAPGIGFAAKQLRLSWPAADGAAFYRVLEDAEGSGVFEVLADNLTALSFTRDIAVHSFDWADARYQVQACNDNGCSTSASLNARDGVLQAIGYFKASNTGSGDTFGWAIAVSDDGNTLAVGAPYEDSAAANNQGSNGATDSGAVYVFAKSGSGWVQQAYLKAQTVLAGANFGNSLALSNNGNTLAVGAAFENSRAGGAYIFSRDNNGAWAQSTRIQASNAYGNAFFGWSVSLSDNGDTLAIGSPGEANSAGTLNTNNHSASNAGAAYVYKLNGGSWGSQVYLKASSIAADDNFGAAIALSGTGTTLVVGAPQKSGGVGRVYVYRNSGSWGAATAIAAANGAVGDNFGATVALDTAGGTLAVGAPYKASNGANAGAAYVFHSSNWTQHAAYLTAANTETDDDFGSALALSGDGSTLAVGAIGEKGSATGINGVHDNLKDGVGAVYLFRRGSDNTWPQQSTYVKPSVSTVGNEFGSAIGMSADGGTLAVSGAFEQSNATFAQIQAKSAAESLNELQPNTAATDAGAVWLF